MFASFGSQLRIHDLSSCQETENTPLKTNSPIEFAKATWSCAGNILLAITVEGKALVVPDIELHSNHSEGAKTSTSSTISWSSCNEGTDHRKQPAFLNDLPVLTCACFSRLVNNHVALGTKEHEVILYDLGARSQLQHFAKHLPTEAAFVEYSPFDAVFAVGCQNGQILIYSAPELVIKNFHVAESYSLSAMSFHAIMANYMAGGSNEGSVCVWNIDTDFTTFLYIPGKDGPPIIDLTFIGNDDLIFVDGKNMCWVYEFKSNSCKSRISFDSPISAILCPRFQSVLTVATRAGDIFRLHNLKDNARRELLCTIPDNIKGLSQTMQNVIVENKLATSTDEGVVISALPTLNLLSTVSNRWNQSLDHASGEIIEDVSREQANNFCESVETKIRALLYQLTAEFNHEFLSMRMDMSRMFCQMERGDQERWMQFNENMQKLVDVDLESMGQSTFLK